MAKSLDQTANQLGEILLSSGLHLATAESCTAGLISMTLAAVENSGDFYTSGFVTYSENAKIRLGVHPATQEQHTAVSEQTVREMAQGTCARSGWRSAAMPGLMAVKMARQPAPSGSAGYCRTAATTPSAISLAAIQNR